MREVPFSWAPVMMALPPAAPTASAIARSSVATNTGPTSAASARFRTWTIIGCPAISASGLLGRRVAAMRAGIRITAEGIVWVRGRAARLGRRAKFRALIRVAFGVAKCSFRLAARLPRVQFRPPDLEPHRDMDSFEFNKIAGAVLGTGLFVMALSIVSELIYEPVEASQPGYVVAIAEAPGGAGTTAAPSGPVQPIAVRLASANVDSGETVGKKCLACHTFLKDQPAKVGPNLWNVLGGPAAHMASFKYSDAMLQEKAKGLAWTYENLDQFLTSPKMFMAGTAMGFAGLPKPEDRADVIAYLRTLADSPVPLPTTASATPPAAPGGPAVVPNPNAPPRSDPLPPPAGGTPAPAPAR